VGLHINGPDRAPKTVEGKTGGAGMGRNLIEPGRKISARADSLIRSARSKLSMDQLFSIIFYQKLLVNS